MASTEALDVPPLDIRPIDDEQADAVWPLSIEAGWNQNLADWRFMLGAGRGFGCVGPDGRWQASSLVTSLTATPGAKRSFQCMGAQQQPGWLLVLGRAGRRSSPRLLGRCSVACKVKPAWLSR